MYANISVVGSILLINTSISFRDEINPNRWVRRVRDAARPFSTKVLDATSVVPWFVDAARHDSECLSVVEGEDYYPPPKSLKLEHVALDNDHVPQSQRWDEGFNRLQILLCSATLANDPQMLASLGLLNPIFYTASEDTKRGKGNQQPKVLGGVEHETPLQSTAQVMAEFSGAQDTMSSLSLPALLQEDVVMCNSSDKPLALIHELRRHHKTIENVKLALVFASSVDTVHRCTRLLQLASIGGEVGKVAELSRGLSAKSRRRLISAANQGE